MSSAEASTKKHRSKKKEKSTSQPASVVTPHGKNEGINTEWAYQPPPGATLINHIVDAGQFDYDDLKGQEEHLEMWIVRIPDTVRDQLSSLN